MSLIALAGISGTGMVLADNLDRPAPPPMPTATAPPSEPAPVSAGAGSGPERTVTLPAAAAPTLSPSPSPSSSPSPTRTPTNPGQTPVRIDIPSIKVAAPLTRVGLAEDGSIGVPPPKRPYLAGWYEGSSAPGEPGRTVVVGHLDSRFSGPAVFYYLGAVRRGQTVTLTRRDGLVVVYRVDGASHQPKDKLPAGQIFGSTGRSELRVITCGGTYDKKSGWSDNVVVYAHLVSSHPATPKERARPLRHDTPRRS